MVKVKVLLCSGSQYGSAAVYIGMASTRDTSDSSADSA